MLPILFPRAGKADGRHLASRLPSVFASFLSEGKVLSGSGCAGSTFRMADGLLEAISARRIEWRPKEDRFLDGSDCRLYWPEEAAVRRS